MAFLIARPHTAILGSQPTLPKIRQTILTGVKQQFRFWATGEIPERRSDCAGCPLQLALVVEGHGEGLALLADRLRRIIVRLQPDNLVRQVRHIGGDRYEVDPGLQPVIVPLPMTADDATFSTGLPVSNFWNRPGQELVLPSMSIWYFQ